MSDCVGAGAGGMVGPMVGGAPEPPSAFAEAVADAEGGTPNAGDVPITGGAPNECGNGGGVSGGALMTAENSGTVFAGAQSAMLSFHTSAVRRQDGGRRAADAEKLLQRGGGHPGPQGLPSCS